MDHGGSSQCWCVSYTWAVSIHTYAKKSDVNHDPAKIARDERKARVAKNERQRAGNVARATNPREERKQNIERTLATTRVSTASMGKFDAKLEGEKKLRGVKRKVVFLPVLEILHTETDPEHSLIPLKHLYQTNKGPLWLCFRSWTVILKNQDASLHPRNPS